MHLLPPCLWTGNITAFHDILARRSRSYWVACSRAPVVPGYGRSGGSPWQATQIVLVLYWNPLLLRTELIRSIWIDCSMNSSTGNPVRRVEYPGCVLVLYVMSHVWNSLSIPSLGGSTRGLCVLVLPRAPFAGANEISGRRVVR